jgi:hypothetical protein
MMEGRDFRRLLAGETELFPLETVRENLECFYVFALQKGEMTRDSRNPGRLEARISVLAPDEPRPRYAAGTEMTLKASVENRGDTLWLATPTPTGGFVSLAAHLSRGDAQQAIPGECFRVALPQDVAPGERVEVECELQVPGEEGRYTLELDLVDKGVAWFAESGSPTRKLDFVVGGTTDSRHPGILRAEIGASQRVWEVEGPGRLLPVRITNRGNTTWLADGDADTGVVCLGGLLGGPGDDRSLRDWLRVPLERSVAPGESVEVECQLRAPAPAGRYVLRLDLLIEGTCWFHERGSVPLDVTLEVPERTFDSASPSQLRAHIEVLTKDSPFLVPPGGRVEIALRIENVGDTIWLHRPDPRGGHVMLGGHLLGAGDEPPQDFLRIPLPSDIAPGESAELLCAFRAPKGAGRHRIELDLVDEGIAWFAAHGSPTIVVEVDTEGS